MFLSQSSSRALPLIDSGRNVDLLDDLHDLVAPLHVDEPLVDQAEEQLRLAAPAVRVAVRSTARSRRARPFFLQVVEDPRRPSRDRRRSCRSAGRSRRGRRPTSSSGATGGRPFSLPSWKSILAAARGDVDDAGALGLADVVPGDDAVRLAAPTAPAPSLACSTTSATSAGIADRVLLRRQSSNGPS